MTTKDIGNNIALFFLFAVIALMILGGIAFEILKVFAVIKYLFS